MKNYDEDLNDALRMVRAQSTLTTAVVIMVEYILSDAHIGNAAHKPLSRMLVELKQIQAQAAAECAADEALYMSLYAEPDMHKEADAGLPCALKEIPVHGQTVDSPTAGGSMREELAGSLHTGTEDSLPGHKADDDDMDDDGTEDDTDKV